MAEEVRLDIEFGVARAEVVNSAFVVGTIVTGACRLLGWSVRETTGASGFSAELTSGNQVIGEIAAGSGQADSHTMPLNGVYCPGGITITTETGAYTG